MLLRFITLSFILNIELVNLFSLFVNHTHKMLHLLIAFAIYSLATPSNIPSTEFASGISRFSSNLFEQCIKSAPNENVIISPFSIATALAFLSQGTNGRTFEQIKNCINPNSDKTSIANDYFIFSDRLESDAGDAIFSIVNKIYVQQGIEIKENFRKVASDKFKSDVESVNFANNVVTAKTINHFIEEKTNGKINELFEADAFSSDSRVVLVNAIHFKGEWQQKFYETSTHKADFYVNDTTKVSVDFMNSFRKFFNFVDLPEFDAKALQMNYANSNFSMVFLLPNTPSGLTAMQSKVKDNLEPIMNQMTSREVRVSIPKFTTEFQIEHLPNVLKNMGMTEMFSEYADLSGLTSEPVTVADVVHKAYISVSEGGSEAAAANGVLIIGISNIPPFNEATFIANHPFMFYIVDNSSKAIIFTGLIKKFN
ncbi:antichymotrypsin-2-like isoform X2 [Contarinia nasturtii]|uniref:antichymotrypsin-2-like isoform X2 n=1 Tax=Contarinia nasturtii TaxID=265458 RepID=UPI0012D4A139|nr:antichymotrypsin-2-like isoform X2 [Contarinia nasturtii]